MKLDKKFSAKLQKSSQKGGWTYVVWPSSVKFFGTRGLVKVSAARTALGISVGAQAHGCEG